MVRTDRRVRICTVLLILNIVFIWGNSLLPGSVSGAISLWVRNAVAFLFPDSMPGPDTGHGLIRKLAHFTEFACLGGLFTWLLSMRGRPAIFALAGGFFVAGMDEIIQCFVPDRGPAFRDVLLDTFGALMGIVLCRIGHTVVCKLAKQSLEDRKT